VIFAPEMLHNSAMSLRPLRTLLLAALMVPNPWTLQAAQAALGSDAASITADAADARGDEVVTALPLFELHVISTGDGLRISEYVDHAGIVFAVTWAGPVLPDLRALLGASYARFAAALAAQGPTASHRSLRVTTTDLVVENSGHMRALTGRAYLPARLPAGVAVTDVR